MLEQDAQLSQRGAFAGGREIMCIRKRHDVNRGIPFPTVIHSCSSFGNTAAFDRCLNVRVSYS